MPKRDRGLQEAYSLVGIRGHTDRKTSRHTYMRTYITVVLDCAMWSGRMAHLPRSGSSPPGALGASRVGEEAEEECGGVGLLGRGR